MLPVQRKTAQCARGLADAVRQQGDPAYWAQNGDAITQDCTAAQAAADAYNAEFGR